LYRRTTQTTRALNVLGWVIVLLGVGLLTLVLYPIASQRPAPPGPVITAPEAPAVPLVETPIGPIPQALAFAILVGVGLGVVVGMGATLALIIYLLDRLMAVNRAHATEAPPAQPQPLSAAVPPPQPPTPLTPLPLEQRLEEWGNQPLRLPSLTSPKVLISLLLLLLVVAGVAYLLSGGLVPR